MEAAGFKPEDYDTDPVEVWPENWQACHLFCCISSQWNAGMAGPTGLRYETLYPLLDRTAQTPQAWDALFEDIRVLEAAALKTFTET